MRTGYGRGYYGNGQLETARSVIGRERQLLRLGDRVRVETPMHDPAHYGRGATVVIVDPGPVYGVVIDGMESMGVHKWYVGDELVLVDSSRRQP